MNYEQIEHPCHKAWYRLLGLENPSLTTAKVCKSSKTESDHAQILNFEKDLQLPVMWAPQECLHTHLIPSNIPHLFNLSSSCMECCFSLSVNMLFWQLSTILKIWCRHQRKKTGLQDLLIIPQNWKEWWGPN